MAYDIRQGGERIRHLRIENGFTQEQIADVLNIDQSYYGRIETGKRGCSVDLLIQLSDLFNVSLDYLILGKFGDNLPKESDVAQLKSDIESLMAQLKQFMTSL